MGTIIPFPNQKLGERLDALRDFLDSAESERLDALRENDLDELQCLLDDAWPGAVAIEQSWMTKLTFTLAGLAIGIGLYP